MSAIFNRHILLISLLGCLTLLPLLILPTLIGAMVDVWGMSEEAAGWSASLNFFGAAFSSLILATRIHHVSLRKVALWGMFATALLDFASGLTGDHLNGFLLARFCAGIGGGVAYTAVVASIARSRTPESGYGLFMSMQFLISGLFLYSLPWIIPEIGTTGIYLGLAVLDSVALILCLQLPAEKAAVQRAEPETVELQILLQRSALLAVLAGGLYEMANTAQFTYGERLGHNLGISATDIGWIMGVGSLLGGLGAFAAAVLGNRIGHLVPLAVGVSGTVVALLIFMSADSLAWYACGSFVAGTGWAFALPYFQSAQASIDPNGSVVAAGSFSATVGNAAGPGFGALILANSTGYGVLLGSAIACALAAFASIVLASRKQVVAV
jgi:predicted MFS family arabinose efflux permease